MWPIAIFVLFILKTSSHNPFLTVIHQHAYSREHQSMFPPPIHNLSFIFQANASGTRPSRVLRVLPWLRGRSSCGNGLPAVFRLGRVAQGQRDACKSSSITRHPVIQHEKLLWGMCGNESSTRDRKHCYCQKVLLVHALDEIMILVVFICHCGLNEN